MPKARTAALRAVTIDESLAEAHASLGLIAESYDYDWQAAEKEFKPVIEIDPNYATAHQWYGEYLSWMGRFDEALAESDRARQLDPMSLIVASDWGAVLYRARRYEVAITQFRAVLDMDPGFTHPYGYLAWCYIAARRFADALEIVEKYIRPRSAPWADSVEAVIYGEWGRKAEAEQALAKFQDCSTQNLQCRNALLGAYVAIGRRHQAIAILEKEFAGHSNIICVLKTEPSFDPLRSDPRFQDLLRSVHLVP